MVIRCKFIQKLASFGLPTGKFCWKTMCDEKIAALSRDRPTY